MTLDRVNLLSIPVLLMVITSKSCSIQIWHLDKRRKKAIILPIVLKTGETVKPIIVEKLFKGRKRKPALQVERVLNCSLHNSFTILLLIFQFKILQVKVIKLNNMIEFNGKIAI